MFDDIDPDTRGVEEAEPALTERFISERQAQWRPALEKALVLGACVSHLKLQAHPLAAEGLRTRWGRRVVGSHEGDGRASACTPEQDEPTRLEHHL